MVRVPAAALLVVIGSGPVGLKDRPGGILLKGLPQELATGQTPVNPDALAAFLGDRGNSGELLDFSGTFETAPIRTERCQQTWGQSGPGTRKAAKQSRVIMLIKQRRDLLIVTFDGFGEPGDLIDERLNHHRRRQNDSAILG